jgi:lipid-A-disaccharide synthase
MSEKKIFIIAGEASGDLHAANLMKEWKILLPETLFSGWGGDRMEKEGTTIHKHIRDLSFMGFLEVLLNLKTILRNIKTCKNQIQSFKPDALVLIDYPGFNLRIAKWAKQNKIPVIYYISPQIWAWKQSRIKQIKRDISKMYCILPFEKEFYSTFDCQVSYLGHPLLDEIVHFKSSTSSLSFSADKPILALLPGSRVQEVKRKLPLMIEASKAFPDYQVVIACSSHLDQSFYRIWADESVLLVVGKTYEILNEASMALVTSGTATLETALFQVPQVVCYKSSAISYRIAKLLIKIKYISLVNLIMNKEVVTELIQGDCTVENMRNELLLLEANQPKRTTMITNYEVLSSMLGENGASKRIATDIIETFFQNKGN